MKKQIVRVSILQSAKVAALLYLFISVPLMALMFFAMRVMPGPGLPMIAMIVMPILYTFFGFVFALVGAWMYNVAASMVGGFEFTTAEVSPG
ncbi:MAG: hypothetical protein M3R60_13295 [Pseudomonadota bacterium]|nr:hypothetical protein [Pseudomonadota bacterium]